MVFLPGSATTTFRLAHRRWQPPEPPDVSIPGPWGRSTSAWRARTTIDRQRAFYAWVIPICCAPAGLMGVGAPATVRTTSTRTGVAAGRVLTTLRPAVAINHRQATILVGNGLAVSHEATGRPSTAWVVGVA